MPMLEGYQTRFSYQKFLLAPLIYFALQSLFEYEYKRFVWVVGICNCSDVNYICCSDDERLRKRLPYLRDLGIRTTATGDDGRIKPYLSSSVQLHSI